MRIGLYDDVLVKLPTYRDLLRWRRSASAQDEGTPLLLLVIVLLALAVRVYRLDGQSLWYDEGNSIALAQRDIPTIIRSAAADIHPPLYYILLHGWVRLAGSSEFAARLPSVLAGVLTVALVYLIGRRLFARNTGLLAALFATVSPFLVYYSQEARMYMLATLLATLSTYLFTFFDTPLLPAQRGSGQPLAARVRQACMGYWLWAAYVLATAAALYSHYFAASVVIGQDAAIMLVLAADAVLARHGAALTLRAWGRRLLPLLAAQAAVALLYLPWLPVMAGQFSNWPAISEFYSLPALVARLFPIFSLGWAAEARAFLPVLLVFAATLLCGMLPPRPGAAPMAYRAGRPRLGALRRLFGRRREYVLAICCLLVPVLVMFVLSLRRPLYNPKFLLIAAPAFCLLLGRGVSLLNALDDTLGRERPSWLALGWLLSLLAALAIFTGSWRSLNAYYFDARYARDDYRSVAQTILAGERSGDAIILDAPGQTDIAGYYYKGSLPAYALPRQRPLDEAATLSELQGIASQHKRIWVVYYGDEQADPRRVIASWLEAQTFKASDRWFGNVRLVLYAIPSAQATAMQPLDVRFGPSIRLVGYRLELPQATAGDIVPLTLYWQTAGVLSERYTVFAHLLSQHEALWGQRDSEPGGGLRPTTTWQAGETIQDNYGLPVLAGAPPGEYRIEIGLYRADSGQRLPVTDGAGKALGDRVLLGPLTVARPASPPATAALGMQHASTAAFGNLRLLGYSLGKLGQDPGATEFASNDLLHLTLFWQAPAQALPDLMIAVQVLDGRGKVVRQRESKPVDGEYPTNGWSAAEIVRDQHRFGLDGLAAGRYRLAVEVREESGRRAGQAVLGEIRVR